MHATTVPMPTQSVELVETLTATLAEATPAVRAAILEEAARAAFAATEGPEHDSLGRLLVEAVRHHDATAYPA